MFRDLLLHNYIHNTQYFHPVIPRRQHPDLKLHVWNLSYKYTSQGSQVVGLFFSFLFDVFYTFFVTSYFQIFFLGEKQKNIRQFTW